MSATTDHHRSPSPGRQNPALRHSNHPRHNQTLPRTTNTATTTLGEDPLWISQRNLYHGPHFVVGEPRDLVDIDFFRMLSLHMFLPGLLVPESAELQGTTEASGEAPNRSDGLSNQVLSLLGLGSANSGAVSRTTRNVESHSVEILDVSVQVVPDSIACVSSKAHTTSASSSSTIPASPPVDTLQVTLYANVAPLQSVRVQILAGVREYVDPEDGTLTYIPRFVQRTEHVLEGPLDGKQPQRLSLHLPVPSSHLHVHAQTAEPSLYEVDPEEVELDNSDVPHRYAYCLQVTAEQHCRLDTLIDMPREGQGGSGHWNVVKQTITFPGERRSYVLQEIYGADNATNLGANLGTTNLGAKETSKQQQQELPQQTPSPTNIDTNNGTPATECVICMAEDRDTLVLPCRHLCLCQDCAEILRFSSTKCPICRQSFYAVLQVRRGRGDSPMQVRVVQP